MWNKKDFLDQKEVIIEYFKKKGVSSDIVSEYCTLTGIPLLVVYQFIEEEMPEHKELCETKIKQVKLFFNIKE